jgi:hypothetical protein
MKVMWASMENLESPFCEYLPEQAAKEWSTASKVTATNYTYTVPQKWWPIFNGVLYETDMTGLVPEGSYTYRYFVDNELFWDCWCFGRAHQLRCCFVGSEDGIQQIKPFATVLNLLSTLRRCRTTQTVVRSRCFWQVNKTLYYKLFEHCIYIIFSRTDHGTFEFFGFAIIRKMVELMPSLEFEHTMLGGDLSYAGLSSAMPLLNIDKSDEFEHIWDLLAIQNQPVAAVKPWMVALGNHESFYNWTALTNRYRMPQSTNPDVKSNGNFWFSYDYGNVHWIGISSEHSLDAGSEQLTFFEADLMAANANRANVPWIMVVLHKPLYCSDDSTPSGYADKLEALCIKYDVDMTLTGHMHAYERVHPVASGAVTVYPVKGHTHEDRLHDVYYSTGKGPVHVVQGNSGAMQFERWAQPAPAWSAVR